MRMMSRTLCSLATTIALAVAGCAGPPGASPAAPSLQGFPVTISSCGFDSVIKAKPARAVTMNQGATEVALALGVQAQLAGTAYIDDEVSPRWKAAYDAVPVLSKEYPSREQVLAAKPDFVYGSYASAFEDKAAGSRAALGELGIATYLSPFGCAENKPDGPSTWELVWSEIDSVGKAFGAADEAATLRAEQLKTLGEVRNSKAGVGLKIFWFDSGDKNAFAGTGEGGPQLIIDAVGAKNVFADVKGGWADVSWEKVIAADPDVIVLAEADWSTVKEKLDRLYNDPALRKLRAVVQNRIVTLPFSETTPGVRLIDGAKAVSGQLAALPPASR